MSARVCLGAIAGPHGVRGAFKIKTFTADEAAIGDYGPLETEDGARRMAVRVVRVLKPGLVLATAPEITSPEAARALSGVKLFVDRSALPAIDDEDEFYIEDLVGLSAVFPDGAPAGRVKAVHDFGAGDILEVDRIPGRNKSALLPFTRALVPTIDLAGGRIILAAEAFEEGAGEPEAGEAATEDDIAGIADPTGEIVSPDAEVNLDAMRAEDA